MTTPKLLEGARQGAHFFDTEGRRTLDADCSAGIFNLGRRRPELAEALKRAARAADQGNFPIISEEKAIERKLSGADLGVVYAEEGVAMGASYAGILSGARNEANAKLFLDFITGREYQQAAADQLHQRSVRRDVDFGLKGIASTKSLVALNYDSLALLDAANAAAASRR